MASVLDVTDPTVRATVDEGRRIMIRLDTPPFVRLMDAAMARWDTSPSAAGPALGEQVVPTAD
jgi:hypothetical protein